MTIPRKQICDECDGSGARSPADIHKCPSCEGRGVRLVRHQLGPGMFQQVQMQCNDCSGRGQRIKHVCPACHGHRIVDGVAELTLPIDRGMPEGAEVLFPGEADESPDFAAGDVVVRVRSKKVVGGLVRKEANLYWRETLSVAEALLGFRKTVIGLDGHEIELKREGVTQPGKLGLARVPEQAGRLAWEADALTWWRTRLRAGDPGRGPARLPRVRARQPLRRVRRRPARDPLVKDESR